MNQDNSFSPAVIEQLAYYVYLLIDPETDKVFYVGKGAGNRIFAHLNYALNFPKESDKLDTIRAIRDRGLYVKHLIHRHGLSEKEAFEVEASLIDFIGLEELTNKVGGHNSRHRGQMTIAEVTALYDAPQIEISEPALLIIVNKLFQRGMDEEDLYEITRGNWVLGVRRQKARYAFAIFNGIVRQVYQIQKWLPAMARSSGQKTRKRWRFEGIVAEDLQHYVGGSVENYITQGAQNPIKYINC